MTRFHMFFLIIITFSFTACYKSSNNDDEDSDSMAEFDSTNKDLDSDDKCYINCTDNDFPINKDSNSTAQGKDSDNGVSTDDEDSSEKDSSQNDSDEFPLPKLNTQEDFVGTWVNEESWYELSQNGQAKYFSGKYQESSPIKAELDGWWSISYDYLNIYEQGVDFLRRTGTQFKLIKDNQELLYNKYYLYSNDAVSFDNTYKNSFYESTKDGSRDCYHDDYDTVKITVASLSIESGTYTLSQTDDTYHCDDTDTQSEPTEIYYSNGTIRLEVDTDSEKPGTLLITEDGDTEEKHLGYWWNNGTVFWDRDQTKQSEYHIYKKQ